MQRNAFKVVHRNDRGFILDQRTFDDKDTADAFAEIYRDVAANLTDTVKVESEAILYAAPTYRVWHGWTAKRIQHDSPGGGVRGPRREVFWSDRQHPDDPTDFLDPALRYMVDYASTNEITVWSAESPDHAMRILRETVDRVWGKEAASNITDRQGRLLKAISDGAGFMLGENKL